MIDLNMKKIVGVVGLTTLLASTLDISSPAQAITFNLSSGSAFSTYSVTLPSSATIAAVDATPNPAYLPNSASANSVWIGPNANSGNDNTLAGGFYFYDTVFNLAGLVLNSTTISDLKVASDNAFLFLRLNGNSLSLPGLPGGSFNSFTTYTLNTSEFISFLNAEANTLSFAIDNQGGAQGFRTEFTVSAEPVPFEFEPTGGLAVLGGAWLLRKRLMKKKATKI